jgi:hypothetical protein
LYTEITEGTERGSNAEVAEKSGGCGEEKRIGEEGKRGRGEESVK